MPPGRAALGGQAQSEKLPFLAKAAVISLLIPANFALGGLQLSPSRVLFLVAVPIMLIKLMSGKCGRLVLADYAFLFYLLWSTIAIAIHHPDVAVSFAGSQALVLMGGYLIARCTISSPAQYRALGKLLFLCVLISVPFTLFEALTNRNLVNEFFNRLPGMNGYARATSEVRMGLYRAQFSLIHPIHYGLFCSVTLCGMFVAWRNEMGAMGRGLRAAITTFACFLSVSSGAFLALMFQVCLIGWDIVLRTVRARWKILLIGFTLFYIVIEIASDRPGIIAILSRISFNPWTVYIRQALFEYGIAQVGQTPVLGVGYNEWDLPSWMSGSIDNHWLLTAITYGLPAFGALFIAFLGTLISVSRVKLAPGSSRDNARLAYAITLVSLIMSMATVAIWGVIYSYVIFIFGSGIWLLAYPQPQSDEAQDESAAENAAQPVNRYTRFPKGAPPPVAGRRTVKDPT